jgi:hypothetical protein
VGILLLAGSGYFDLRRPMLLIAAMVVRFFPLCISVLFAALIALLVLTPLAWNLMGRPDETYPEIVYLALGGPPALILLVASSVIALRGSQRLGGALQPALRPLWLCIAVAVPLTALVLTPVGNLIPKGAAQAVVDFTFHVAWPALAVSVMAASIWAWTRPRSSAPV